jgi:hypothetical protein
MLPSPDDYGFAKKYDNMNHFLGSEAGFTWYDAQTSRDLAGSGWENIPCEKYLPSR